jgi:hypothetical protein
MMRSPHIPPWFRNPMVTLLLVRVPSMKEAAPEITTARTTTENAGRLNFMHLDGFESGGGRLKKTQG